MIGMYGYKSNKQNKPLEIKTAGMPYLTHSSEKKKNCIQEMIHGSRKTLPGTEEQLLHEGSNPWNQGFFSLETRKMSLAAKKCSLTPNNSSLAPRKQFLLPRKLPIAPRTLFFFLHEGINPWNPGYFFSWNQEIVCSSKKKYSLAPRKWFLSTRIRSMALRKSSREPRKHSLARRNSCLAPRKWFLAPTN